MNTTSYHQYRHRHGIGLWQWARLLYGLGGFAFILTMILR